MIGALVRTAESAPVTSWGPRILLTVVTLAIIGLGVWGMRRGWTAREARQGDLPALPVPPAGVLAQAGPGESDEDGSGRSVAEPAGVAGLYVATTTAGDLLDRIVAHGMGYRCRATLRSTDQGVLLERTGEADLWIPRSALTEVRLGSGQAQKAFEAGGLILIGWQWGPRRVETGFRADDPEAHVATAQALSLLVPTGEGSR
ncbi:MAG: hypothetical protein WCF36_06590 [Candidatus Nanopelagicales bacterium]